MKIQLLSFFFVFLLSVSFADDKSNSKNCKKVLKKSAAANLTRLETLVRHPRDLIQAEDTIVAMGGVIKRWDPKFKTAFYHTMSEPNADGTVPLVDPKAKGVVIFFHGSGTAKASGKNFADKMNPLRGIGMAGVAFDLPFHADNPGGEAFNKMDYFMEWLHGIVQEIKAGKNIPIYLAGHSFGPEVAQEYASRYPEDVKGLLLISPAGDYHPALKWTYEHITDPGMKFLPGDPTVPNDAGGEWAGKMATQFTWFKKTLPPDIKVMVRLGEEDEWWPGNKKLPALVGVEQKYTMEEPVKFFKEKYPNADFQIIPGVGHMIFDAVTPKGKNLIQDSIFELVGVPEDKRDATWTPLTPRERVKAMNETSPAFREWLGNRYPHTIRDAKRSELVLKDWAEVRFKAWKAVMDRIPTTHPEFLANRRYLYGLAKRNLAKPDAKISDVSSKQLQSEFNAYLAHLESGKKEPFAFGKDPAAPPALVLDEKLLTGEFKSSKRTAQSPLRSQEVLASLNKFGQKVKSVSPFGENLVKINVEFRDKDVTDYVLKDMSNEEIQGLIQKAYLNAYEKNNYMPPEGNNWTGEAGGVIFEVQTQGGTNVKSVSIRPVQVENN